MVAMLLRILLLYALLPLLLVPDVVAEVDLVLDITRVIEKEKPSTVDHVLLDAGLGGVLDSHVHDVFAQHHHQLVTGIFFGGQANFFP